MNHQPIGVTVVLLDPNGQKVLLGKRKNSYKAGTYGVPGGRVELQEPLLEAVKRELLEETSVEAEEIRFVGVIRDFQETYSFIHFAFVCTTYKGTPSNTEPEKCEGWDWYLLDELPENTLQAHRAAIELWKNPEKPGLVDIV